MFLPLRRSDQLLITQDLHGRLYVGVVGPEKGGLRLSPLLVGQQSAWLKGEDDTKEVLLRVLFVRGEVVKGPRGSADIWPLLLTNAELDDELLR